LGVIDFINITGMKNNVLLFFKIVIFVGILSGTWSLKAQPVFNSSRLGEIFNMLPSETQDKIKLLNNTASKSYFLNEERISKNQQIIIRFNQYNELEHLGLFLINSKGSGEQFREIFDFLERTFLVYALTKDNSMFLGSSKKGYIEMLQNGNLIKNQNQVPSSTLLTLNEKSPFKLDSNSKEFKATWKTVNSGALAIKIPNNLSQIAEKTKEELERDLIRKIRNSDNETSLSIHPLRSQLEYKSGNIYMLKGESYLLKIGITSNSYYMISDSIFPVFDGKYYKESICNLFLNLIPTRLKVSITQKLYGGIEENYLVNINSFLQNFSVNHKIYFGWQNDDKNNLKATIIIANTIYNYTHLLVIESNTKNIFGNAGSIKGTFYAFTPKNNLKQQTFNN
jgi:hypothetical protein